VIRRRDYTYGALQVAGMDRHPIGTQLIETHRKMRAPADTPAAEHSLDGTVHQPSCSCTSEIDGGAGLVVSRSRRGTISSRLLGGQR